MDLDYLIGVDSDHLVKFRGDRPRDLGDPVSDQNNEIWGRAQHEAARRPMSDLKYILGSCKMCKNLRGQHP